MPAGRSTLNLKHRQFIEHLKQRAFQSVVLKGFSKLLLVKVKGILCNIFVKKMKTRAAQAFWTGAMRGKRWSEVAHWRRVCDTRCRHLDDMEQASLLLSPAHPYWQTVKTSLKLENISSVHLTYV
jgi:hypothetical protein